MGVESQESGPPYSSHRSFTSDWLYSADRLCLDGIDGGEKSHQLPGFITSYLATPEEKESLTNGICLTNPGWILIGSPWQTYPSTPINPCVHVKRVNVLGQDWVT